MDPSSLLAAANQTLPSNVSSIQGFANTFAAGTASLIATLDGAAVDIGRAAFIFLIIAGVLLWFSRVNKHLGKELVEGGVIIALFIEFVVPILPTIKL